MCHYNIEDSYTGNMYMGMYPIYIFNKGRLLGDHHYGLIRYKGAYDKR
jgi:hypothetical protein